MPEFSRPEYWRGSPSPGDLLNPGIEPSSPALQANSLPSEPQGKPRTKTGGAQILKEISPEYALEELLLKLKLQYFGHLIRRADTLEKIVKLGKI